MLFPAVGAISWKTFAGKPPTLTHPGKLQIKLRQFTDSEFQESICSPLVSPVFVVPFIPGTSTSINTPRETLSTVRPTLTCNHRAKYYNMVSVDGWARVQGWNFILFSNRHKHGWPHRVTHNAWITGFATLKHWLRGHCSVTQALIIKFLLMVKKKRPSSFSTKTLDSEK